MRISVRSARRRPGRPPIGLLVVCAGAFLVWVSVVTHNPVHRDTSDPEVGHWSDYS
ncbi:hypothetical protein [Streptomyces tendae]